MLDATFHKKATRQLFVQGIGKDTRLVFIEMIASEDLVRKRLKKVRTESEADIDVYKKIGELWEPLDARHLTLESANNNIDHMLQKALEYLPA